MTLAVTAVQCKGIEVEEAVNKRYRQKMILSITGANTDVTYDLGTYAGTFWTATSGSTPGAAALKAIKDIQTRAKSFRGIGGTKIAGKVQVDSSYVTYAAYDTTASLGGAATEAVTCTGLLSTDTILAVSQKVKGANSTALNGFNTLINDGITLSWTGNPGANAVATVLVSRTVTAVPSAGTYFLSMDGTNTQLPNITFFSTDAPTTLDLILEWDLKDGEEPVELAA